VQGKQNERPILPVALPFVPFAILRTSQQLNIDQSRFSLTKISPNSRKPHHPSVIILSTAAMLEMLCSKRRKPDETAEKRDVKD
jgi:hypothetical protein